MERLDTQKRKYELKIGIGKVKQIENVEILNDVNHFSYVFAGWNKDGKNMIVKIRYQDFSELVDNSKIKDLYEEHLLANRKFLTGLRILAKSNK